MIPPGRAPQLLASVLAAPDDDGPRLVYADWLTERGDPRGAFIADQHRLAETDEADPAWPALHARVERALRDRGRDWVAPFAGLAGAVSFSRGFAEGVDLGEVLDPLPKFKKIAAAAPIRAVTLSRPSRWGPSPARAAPLDQAIGELASLGVRRVRVDGATAADLAGFDRGTLRGVEALDLRTERYRQEDATRLVPALAGARLRVLRLRGFDLTADQIDQLADEGAFAGLSALSIERAPVAERGLERLARALPQRLAALSLADNRGSLASLGAVLERIGPSSLDLSGGVSVPVLEALIASDAMQSVRHLSLRRPSGKIKGRIERLFRRVLPALTRLDLGESDLSDADMRALARSPFLPQLTALHLDGTPVGDRGLGAFLAATPASLRIVSLSLSNTRIGGRGLRALAKWPGLRNVAALALPGRDLPPIVAEGLAAAPGFDPARLSVRGPRTILNERWPKALARGFEPRSEGLARGYEVDARRSSKE